MFMKGNDYFEEYVMSRYDLDLSCQIFDSDIILLHLKFLQHAFNRKKVIIDSPYWKSASSCHHQQTGSFRAINRLPVKTMLDAEKQGLSWLKRHNFVVCRYVSTKLRDLMYILLFNSCVNSVQKSSRSADISPKVAGGTSILTL